MGTICGAEDRPTEVFEQELFKSEIIALHIHDMKCLLWKHVRASHTIGR